MKLKQLLTTLAAAVGLTTAATAATPTVVWDRDFDTTTKVGTDGKTYTFADNGNDVDNGIISVTQAYGATVTFPEQNANGYTVIIKYSNLSAISDRMPIFAGFATSYSDASDYGVAASANGGLGLSGYWFERTSRYTFGTVPTLAEGSGYVVMAHKISNNMKTYAGATLAEATGTTCGLKFSSGNATAIGLGGASKDSSSATCGLTGWNNGLRIEAVAIFAGQFYAATDVASYKFPSECGVLKNARWGNIGDAINGGVATGADQAAAANTSYTVNFGTTDNICTTEIGSKGTVKIKTLKVVAHGTAGNMPPSITLTQGSLSATSTALDSSQTISIYKSNKTVYETKQLLLYTFAGDVAFDTSADITMSFANGTAGQGGCRFVTPANSKMKFNGTWSPAVEFVGDYTVARRSISINFNSGAGSVSGTYGVFPSSTWNNYSDATCSGGKTANVSDGSTVTVKWWSHNTYSWGGNDVDAALRGYLDDGACGDGTTGNGPHIGITGIPFEKYDVIAYLATDTSGRNFAPPAIGTFTGTSACATTAYSYDGLTSANRNTASLNFGTSRNATAQLGVNVVYLKKGFSQSDLDIKGGQNDNSTCRGGIAAIQIVEAFPSDYAASVDAATATWSTQDGLTAISGRPDGENTDSSTLTLSNTTQDDATVNFDTSAGYKTIAVSSASGKSTTLSCTVPPAVGGNYEIGGLATMTYVPNKPITILSGGTLTLANETAGTQDAVISGDGALDIAGPVTLSKGNTFKGTMTVKNGGTLTMGSASCLNNSNAVTIEQGGVVDNNGKVDSCNNFTLAGGTLVNNAGEMGLGSMQMASVTVTADSTIGGTGNFGLLNSGYGATTLTLNENTTLTKTGANSFWLLTTTVNGTGKLAIKQGTVNCANKGSGAVNFKDATVELDGGNLEVNKAATLKNLSYKSGTLKANAAISGLTDISGDFDTTSSSCLSGSGALGFADAVTFHDGTIRLNESILTTLGTDKTVTIGDNGILDIRAARAIKVASIGTDAKLAVKQQASETETITVTDTTLEDGDYIAKVMVIEASDDAVTMPITAATVSGGTLTITLDQTVFAYEATESTTISAIETAVLGAGKTFEKAAQLTITATGNPTITVDKNLNITKFALVGEATLKFNSGMTITAPTISAEDTVTIDCTGIAAGEHTYFVGTIADTTKFTASNVPEGQGIYVTATGVTIRKTANTTYANPVVTTEEKTFAQSFFGTTDAAWDTLANWRKAEGGLWIPATVVPGKQDGGYGPLVLDGNMTSEKTVTAAQLEGWTPQYALYNGMNVTVTTLVKMQTNNEGFIWVDDSSSITFNTSGGNNHGTLALAVANADGVTFTQKWSAGDNTISYYLKGAGTVNYAAGVSAGTHKIAQMDLTVGETAKDCRHVAKQKLVNFGASSGVTFSAADGIVVNLDNGQVTAVGTNETVTVAMPVGTYKIETESDGVYAYIVQYADAWDIVEPLSATLTANAKFSEITTWTDFYGHTGADLTKAHTYKLTAGEFTATLDAAPADGSSIELVSGTLALNDAEVIEAGTAITVDADATLSVTASGLVASKVTNNGTIAFAGGTADTPIAITGDADFGVVTLAADAFVKNTETTNHKHLVTGAGATSCYQMWRDGETGFSDGSALTNLTLVVNNTIWLERVSLTADNNVYLEANAQVILNQINPVICGLTGSGSLTQYISGNPTICCKKASTYSGTSSLAFTIAEGTAVQTLSGAYTGALTVNEGATVALDGSATPSSIVNNGTVEWLKAYDIGESRAFDETLGTVIFTGGVTATQTRQEYAQGLVSAFTGFPENTKITLTKLDGTSEELTVDAEGKASSKAGAIHIDGKACLFDVTFTNKENASQFAYKAVNATLQYDSTATFYDPEKEIKDRGVYIKHHPYINGAASTFYGLTDFTTVVVGQMSPSNNTQFIHFGSCTGSNPGLLIATTENKDEVVVLRNAGTTLAEIKRLSVPNAATARHVYIITKKDVAATAQKEAHSVFTIYLDGVKKATVPMDGIFKLGTSGHSGVQVGSAFGGTLNNGTYKSVSVSDAGQTGYISVLRVYDYLMTDAQATALTAEYPYESEGGLFLRDVEGDVNYAAASTWTKSGEATADYEVPTGTGGFAPSATLEATGDGATVTVNTNSTIDVFTFNGNAMSFVKDAGGTNAISVSTAVINAPVTVEYGAVDLKGATVSLSDSGSLAFDFSGLDLQDYFTTTKIQVTGLTEQNEKITKTLPAAAYGRTASFAFEGTAEGGEYYLTITVDTTIPFIYTIGATEEEGTWTFGEEGEEISQEIVDANKSRDIWKKGDGSWTNVVINRTYVVKEGTMVAGDAKDKTGTVTVEADATFDFNGQKDGYTTINLNGGSLVNNGDEMGTSSRQIEGMTLTADSTVGGTGTFGMSSSAHHANTLDLGGATLTKEGANTFFLCNTTVTNGNVTVTGGTLQVVEATTFSEATLALAANTTLDVDSTLTIGAINADGATIDNAGTISGFTLTGTATLTGNGTWGTITNAADAVATIGTERDFVFAGAGTVNVTLTDDEIEAGTPITLFETNGVTTTAIGTITYNNKDITEQCGKSGNQITSLPSFEATVGTTYYLTLAAALDAATENAQITLLKDVTFAPDGMYSITNTIYLTLNGFDLTGNGGKTFEVVNNAALYVTATDSTVTGVRINVGTATDNNGTLYISGGTWTIDDNTLVHVNGTCTSSLVTIQDAKMTSDGDNAIQLNGSGTFTLEDVEVMGATAVYAKGGTIAMSGSFTGKGALTPYTVNHNGSNFTGDAVVFEKVSTSSGYANNLSVTVSGGTFTSENGAAIGSYAMEGETAISGFITGGEFKGAVAMSTGLIEPKTGNTASWGAAETEGYVKPVWTPNQHYVTFYTNEVEAAKSYYNYGDASIVYPEIEGVTAWSNATYTAEFVFDGTIDDDTQAAYAKIASAEPVEPGNDGTEITKNVDGSVTIEENKVNPGQASITLNDTTTTIKVTSTIDTLTVAGETPAAGQIKVYSAGGTEITSLCKMTTTGNTIDVSLNPDATSEGVKVRPEIEVSAATPTPFVVGDNASTTVKTISGLTYKLVRDNAPGGTFATTVVSAPGDGNPVTLTDSDKPEGKAFYKVQVTK